MCDKLNVGTIHLLMTFAACIETIPRKRFQSFHRCSWLYPEFLNKERSMRNGFTVGQIARALRCHERSARLYLREVNAAIDHYAQDVSEFIDLATVVALYRRHQGERLAQRLIPLLQLAA